MTLSIRVVGVVATIAAAVAVATGCDELCEAEGSGGVCDLRRECPNYSYEIMTSDYVEGQITCVSPDAGGTPQTVPLAAISVHSDVFEPGQTDCQGRFRLRLKEGVTLDGDRRVDVNFDYEGDVPGPDGMSTRLKVMDDTWNPWGTNAFHFGFFQGVEGTVRSLVSGTQVLTLDPVVIETSECDVWRAGAAILADYQETVGAPVPNDELMFMRRSGVFDTTPYVFYNYVELASNILDLRPQRAARDRTLFHEAGHIVRHVADGDWAHWSGDNTLYRYARCHTGREITEEPYAFNEGWATYWAAARFDGHNPVVGDVTKNKVSTAYCGGVAGPVVPLTPGHLDWVEHMIADRLLDLAACVGAGDLDAGDRAMVQTLEANPGTIHRLYDFETALCSTRSCCGLERPDVPYCPPAYTDDGLTCRAPDGSVISHYRL